MRKRNGEKGAVMVEAAIYMPLVLCTVMALIYLALLNMQEHLLMYEAQRVAAILTRETAYTGYEEFDMGADNEIDFAWGEGNYPSDETVTAYYTAHHASIADLYREVPELLGAGQSAVNNENEFLEAAKEASLIAFGTISRPEINIDKSLLGTNVTVTFTHEIPTPGVMKYLGFEGSLGAKSTAYTYSGNPAGFVRNVNLATDLVSYVLEKLGMKDQMDQFVDKTRQVIQKIL